MPFFLWELICCAVILFGAGIFIDWIRSMLFAGVRRILGKTVLFEKIRKLDEA